MPKKDDLDGEQNRMGEKVVPKPVPEPGHYLPQKVEHEKDGKKDKSR